MINKTIAIAGVLSLVLTAIHVFGGGADVHGPILASGLDNILKGFSSVVWHAVTANLLLCSFMLLYASYNKAIQTPFTLIVIAHFLAYAGLFIFYGLSRFDTLFVMMPWIAFLFISAVATIGIIRAEKAKISAA
ncbi:MAG: hypothetical protein ABJE63_03110 [Lentilitoribacter sp.]